MTYVPWNTNSMNEDTLLFGDDKGRTNIGTVWSTLESGGAGYTSRLASMYQTTMYCDNLFG